MLCICATLQKFKAKAGKKPIGKHLGKEVQRQLRKRRWRFLIEEKSLSTFRKMSGTVILKIPLIFVSQSENKVLCHFVFLYLGYPVALRELLLPTRDVWHRHQPHGSAAGRRAPLPGCFPAGSWSEWMDLSPVKWEGNRIRKKELSHRLQKEESKIKQACDWDSLMLTQAGLPGANPVLKMSYINPDD